MIGYLVAASFTLPLVEFCGKGSDKLGFGMTVGIYWLGNTARSSTVIYYAEYNLGHKNLASILNGLVVLQMASITVLPYLVKRIIKSHTQIIGLSLAALGQI